MTLFSTLSGLRTHVGRDQPLFFLSLALERGLRAGLFSNLIPREDSASVTWSKILYTIPYLLAIVDGLLETRHSRSPADLILMTDSSITYCSS